VVVPFARSFLDPLFLFSITFGSYFPVLDNANDSETAVKADCIVCCIETDDVTIHSEHL
jgi:hypothetical protein